ncbi:hypothetical protein ACQPZF_10890 [Actinosynnema sp. CS-041913]|uniref:hypothetical protein n=1 Tax=Actinosynnema sp. CS-041913 TaxID=3239917 RepID=UPI003D92BED2
MIAHVRGRRPHPATVIALFAIAGSSQIIAGFDGRPTPLQLAMTILHTLVAGGAAGWMALPERQERSRGRPKTAGGRAGDDAHKKVMIDMFGVPEERLLTAA